MEGDDIGWANRCQSERLQRSESDNGEIEMKGR